MRRYSRWWQGRLRSSIGSTVADSGPAGRLRRKDCRIETGSKTGVWANGGMEAVAVDNGLLGMLRQQASKHCNVQEVAIIVQRSR